MSDSSKKQKTVLSNGELQLDSAERNSKNETQVNLSGHPGESEELEDDGITWKHSLSQLHRQQTLIRTPNPTNGGYIRQKRAGKLWVHERLASLLDNGSFSEIGSLTGKAVYDKKTGETKDFTPANSVIGFGKIQGRRVFVVADDFSVRGGHADGGIAMKAPYGEVLARKNRVPLIRLLDGSSGGGSVATYLSLGATYIPPLAGLGQSLDALAVVPVASALLGPVVGLGAAKAVTSHFSVMVKGLSQLFAAGPPVVKQATFEDLDKEALGGWAIHATNGSVDNVASSEHDAYAQIRRFLSYMPSSIFHIPPVGKCNDDVERKEEELLGIVPRRRARIYDMRRVIQLIVDCEVRQQGEGDSPQTLSSPSSFFEIGATWGSSVIVGFARLDGRPVGVLASDCSVTGGVLDAYGSQKTTRFVNMCNHFGLPLLNLVDQPGFAVGSIAEKTATIRHGASAIAALYNATIPIFTVIIRRAFGVAGGAFADPEDGRNRRIAWPSGDWGSLPLEGGIEAAYKRQLEGASSPEAREELRQRLLAQFEEVRNPIRTAHAFGVEELIDPRNTRPMACDWACHVYENILPPRLVLRQSTFGLDGKPSQGKEYKL